eukprot:5806307-Prymnesium_polylepis.1
MPDTPHREVWLIFAVLHCHRDRAPFVRLVACCGAAALSVRLLLRLEVHRLLQLPSRAESRP